nr:hypothetical transcript [Hymenolepis microstoma]
MRLFILLSFALTLWACQKLCPTTNDVERIEKAMRLRVFELPREHPNMFSHGGKSNEESKDEGDDDDDSTEMPVDTGEFMQRWSRHA